MTRVIIALAALLLLAAPVGADFWSDLWTDLDPDAVIVTEPLGSADALSGVSKQLGSIKGHRLWLDLYQPLEKWGLGGSADIVPGRAASFSGGYARGEWFLGISLHADL